MAVDIETFLFIKRCDNLEEVQKQVEQIVTKASAASIGDKPRQCITDVKNNLNKLVSPFKLKTSDCGFKLFKGSNYYLLEAPDIHTPYCVPDDITDHEKQQIHDDNDQFSSWFNFPDENHRLFTNFKPKVVNDLTAIGRIVVTVSGVYKKKDIDSAVKQLGTDGEKIKPQLEAAFEERKDKLRITSGNLGLFALPSSKI